MVREARAMAWAINRLEEDAPEDARDFVEDSLLGWEFLKKNWKPNED